LGHVGCGFGGLVLGQLALLHLGLSSRRVACLAALHLG
jgi:hypothetical protein